MPYLPNVKQNTLTRTVTDSFRGYHRDLRIGDGEFFFTENLTSEHCPLLATRKPRGLFAELTEGQGMLGKEQLAWVDGGTLYYGGLPTPVTGLAPGEKQLVSMGAYLCIFPDKVFYNTQNGNDHGSMECRYESPGVTCAVRYEACLSDGSLIGDHTVSDTEPPEPEEGDLWVSTGDGSYYRYSEVKTEWVLASPVFTKITFPTYDRIGFREYDGVRITGARYDCLNGSKIIYGCGGSSADRTEDFIVVAGIIPENLTDEAGKVTVERTVPEMDFVCECQNRLWGCYFGPGEEGVLNEIYCSALGDFTNWSQYLETAADSWTASVGSDGEWTGCINYLGYPTFFKENVIHKVVISPSGNHQIAETPCRGVQKGSHRSLCIVGETLYYKSRTDVCAWQGGFPVTVSADLGEERYSDAVGGGIGTRYYLSVKDSGGTPQLFVYDTARRLWMREDSLPVRELARADDSLFALCAGTAALRRSFAEAEDEEVPDGGDVILDLNGVLGITERRIPFTCESGILTYEDPDHKYLQRYHFRLQCAGTVRVQLEYDSGGVWTEGGSFTLNGLNSVTVPVRPRRCDHLRVKLTGDGPVRIFSVARLYERGSDV